MSNITSRAHMSDYMLKAPFRLAELYPAEAVPFKQRDGRLHCEFCGSLHPTEVVTLLKAGASIERADMKYGWPHKFYLNNPWGKFYSVHLVDATPEEYEFICQKIGLYIEYNPVTEMVRWHPWKAPQ